MKRNLIFLAIHSSVWCILIALPLFFTNRAFANDESEILFWVPLPFWITIGLLIVIFYLNYYVFIPQFLFPRKYAFYAIILVGLFLIFIEAPRAIADLVVSKPPERLNREVAEVVFPILFSNVFLMYIAVFFSSIALRLSSRWFETEEERHRVQMSYLTSQISPHFLFNTLNSIYGLAIVKAPKAADMVGKLSEMMRYTLDSSRNEMVPLTKELDYLRGYIELQKVRLDENIETDILIEEDENGKQIAPLILLPFIENAFKYGVNAEQNSKIKIHIKLNEQDLKLTVFNNKVDVDSQHLKKSGFGIENTKKRLNLIYPERHELEIIENSYDFMVKLQIQLG
ncbi:MAG: sensor histidine kinase [Balneolaceae bacterium]